MTCPPPPPPELAPYVEALGVPLAVKLFLELGGAELHVSDKPALGRLARVVGRGPAERLAQRMMALDVRIPLGNRWVARVLRAEGVSVAEIARRLRTTDVTVRTYLGRSPSRARRADARQLPLF